MYKVVKVIKDMPTGISLFLIFFIILEVYYFFFDYLFYGIYAHHGYTIESLSYIPYFTITLFLFIVTAFALIIIAHGFLNRKNWARKFTILFTIWAALWTIWGMLIGNKVAAHFVLFVAYVLIIVYLMSSYVKEYFRNIYRYGEYTLYKRDVALKSGKTVTIHFFSKNTPKSGTPTHMPEGYEVGISERSNMPFLRKIGRPRVYKYGKYTLYKRKVNLKAGKTVIIYFFSSKKPKSGTPTHMPEGYEVGISERSNMPYLKKQKAKQTTITGFKDKMDVNLDEKKIRKPSNVIYVVNKPQPGQVRGDWAVRGHGKIYSHHRTKENAIKQARVIAKQRNATVMVQNTDGTFSRGFKPKKR
ncbi:MAG: DUF2188 domain-containing protein [Thermoplasmatales archaeon]|nr:MAG: DUF2188 domain-containing protein [Thermoplasmatales archaeon]